MAGSNISYPDDSIEVAVVEGCIVKIYDRVISNGFRPFLRTEVCKSPGAALSRAWEFEEAARRSAKIKPTR